MGKQKQITSNTLEHPEPQLIKHNAAIHCSNNISLLQRKISNALLYNAYEQLANRDIHEIELAYLCRLIGYSGHNYAAIKDAFKQLIATIIEWNLVDTSVEDWSASSLLASVRIKGTKCYYEYSKRLKELFYQPTIYSKINMVVQSKFHSNYGLALYENTVRYRRLSWTKWFDIDLFRRLMGVPDDKYKIFRDFKKRVLDKSIEEVNKYSDIYVEAELAKSGRKVIKLRFLVKERKKKVKFNTNSDSITSEELEKALLSEFGLTVKQVSLIHSQYEVDYIYEKVQLIKKSNSYKAGNITNLASYLISALENNYQNNSQYLPNTATVNTKVKKLTETISNTEINVEMPVKVINIYNALDKNLQEMVFIAFSDFVAQTSYYSLFKEKSLTDPLIQMQLYSFICSHQASDKIKELFKILEGP